MIQYELPVDYLVNHWYVPVQDLVAIYELYYGEPDRVTADMIQNCTDILYKGTWVTISISLVLLYFIIW